MEPTAHLARGVARGLFSNTCMQLIASLPDSQQGIYYLGVLNTLLLCSTAEHMETRDLDPSILLVSLVYNALWLVARILDSQPEIFVVVCRSGAYIRDGIFTSS